MNENWQSNQYSEVKLTPHNQNAYLPKLRVAVSDDEKDLIYKLRYKVYIEDLNEPLMMVDHVNKRIKDHLDEIAVHVAAFTNNNQVVCSGRLNLLDETNRRDFSYLHIGKIDDSLRSSVVVGSNVVIDYDYRDLGMMHSILQSMYKLSLRLDAKAIVAGIPNFLVPTFSKMGFISYHGQVYHPEQGLVTPMYLDVQNENFMIDIDSPFLDIYKEYKNDTETSLLN